MRYRVNKEERGNGLWEEVEPNPREKKKETRTAVEPGPREKKKGDGSQVLGV